MREFLTVGHSTLEPERFLAILSANRVCAIADIRTMPRSRRNPQFNREALPPVLRARGITYAHLAGLGGLRRARAGSANTAWRNASFRGFADYMLTPEFDRALLELLGLPAAGPLALMCAEALPWRCHRWLIADALVARGIGVVHIMSSGGTREHRLTRFAQVRDGRVTYPGPA